ncbi:MAG TPA: DUF4381 domain-containing protein [Candidatus Acidoferrum sp.]|nr:DUF4381 domain-containing protein [Candidatus Acidoferrum sp.]
MEAKDPLSDLADIHLPQPVSAWPPAPLWWMLGALVLAVIAWFCLVWLRNWQQRQRLHHALAEIRAAHEQWQQAGGNDTAPALLHACNSVLKRVALVHHPEAVVAGLSGQRWLTFLDDSGATDAFTQGAGQLLADGGYRRRLELDEAAVATLIAAIEKWIARQYQRKQRRPVAEPLQAVRT